MKLLIKSLIVIKNTKIILTLVLLTVIYNSFAQPKVVLYEESDEDVVNPERGFYIPSDTKPGGFEKLDETLLRSYRTESRKVGRSSYSVKVTLIYRGYELSSFRNQPLSDEFLRNIQDDFNTVRNAGLKIILRFMYTNKSHPGDCPGKQICPPYGDAPRHIVLNHIKQLKPLLRKNADIIAVLQEGFIGIWGENYFTDYFGDASTTATGNILDSSWAHRNEILKALLDAMPENRIVQVRTPQIKQKYVYGASAPVTSKPLDSSQAFDGSDNARIGFHNDCFLASADDYGTYYDNGSSTQSPGPANELLRKYIEADTKYTAVGGETCDDAFSPQNDCAPAGYAEDEMRRMHYSYLNAAYNNNVNNDWDSAGCMMNIKKHLGYRIVLRKLEHPARVSSRSPLELKFTLENEGYASPFNPRPVLLVLRNKQTGDEIRVTLTANPRTWFAGVHKWTETVKLPTAIKTGSYHLLLSLPDASASLSNRVDYNLLFANKNIVEEKSGYMDLGTALDIE